MEIKNIVCWMSFFLLVAASCEAGAVVEPSDPDATPGAKALLELFYKISGNYTLTGQHNFPNARERNSRFYAKPKWASWVIWSGILRRSSGHPPDFEEARIDRSSCLKNLNRP